MIENWAREFSKEHGFKDEIFEYPDIWEVNIGLGFWIQWDGAKLIAYSNGMDDTDSDVLTKTIKSAQKKIAEVRKRK